LSHPPISAFSFSVFQLFPRGLWSHGPCPVVLSPLIAFLLPAFQRFCFSPFVPSSVVSSQWSVVCSPVVSGHVPHFCFLLSAFLLFPCCSPRSSWRRRYRGWMSGAAWSSDTPSATREGRQRSHLPRPAFNRSLGRTSSSGNMTFPTRPGPRRRHRPARSLRILLGPHPAFRTPHSAFASGSGIGSPHSAFDWFSS
jgi:hypothetical protein